jgi:hypothetical protein
MNFMVHKLAAPAAAVAVLFALASAPAQAITFSVGSDPAATAEITTFADGLTITLTNDLATPIEGVVQALSEIYFDASGLTAVSGSVSAGTGTVIDVSSLGAVTVEGSSGDAWGLAISGTSLRLSTLIFGPDFTLLPTQSDYASANSSIKDNDPHNPFYQGEVSFTLTGLTGLTANSVISNVVFNFGTEPLVPVPSIPEPQTYALMLAGLGVVGFMARRRRPQ